MTAIGPSLARLYDTPSDAQIELTHYRFELRVHALIVLFSATLIGYLGFRVWNMADEPRDALSYCVVAIVIAIATICLVEAHRSWRQAATIGNPVELTTSRSAGAAANSNYRRTAA
jgi:hypothetical protein